MKVWETTSQENRYIKTSSLRNRTASLPFRAHAANLLLSIVLLFVFCWIALIKDWLNITTNRRFVTQRSQFLPEELVLYFLQPFLVMSKIVCICDHLDYLSIPAYNFHQVKCESQFSSPSFDTSIFAANCLSLKPSLLRAIFCSLTPLLNLRCLEDYINFCSHLLWPKTEWKACGRQLQSTMRM
jgi:hypothetical protein